jgi:hypothetical protein
LSTDKLQMPKFMKKHLVEKKAAYRYRRPFPAWNSTKLLRSMAPAKVLRQAHARRKCAQSNFAPTTVDITEQTGTSTAVVEVDGAKPTVQIERQTAKDDAHVFLADMVDTVSAGGRHCEFDVSKHYCGRPPKEQFHWHPNTLATAHAVIMPIRAG